MRREPESRAMNDRDACGFKQEDRDVLVGREPAPIRHRRAYQPDYGRIDIECTARR
jgi:hypothetical protein